jgi:hypothetical protein
LENLGKNLLNLGQLKSERNLKGWARGGKETQHPIKI